MRMVDRGTDEFRRGKMYCRLTGSLLDCNARMAAKHMKGKKFKARKGDRKKR